MKLVVGLGNPGDRYSNTRHNLGRSVVDFFAASERKSFLCRKKLQASLASLTLEGEEFFLAIPEMYMNLSGAAVKALVEDLGVDFGKDLLVVVDDVALPFGKMRLRSRGSDGGHNGLKSIDVALGSSNYARLRLGIAPAELHKEQTIENLEEYVLSRWSREESRQMESFLRKGTEACKWWCRGPISAAMNVINASGN